MKRNHPAFDRLPERLTISFPIWGLYDIDGKGYYADVDRMVREHVERGFNCIRLDDGAGLMHDFDGNPLGPVEIGNAFGEYDRIPRQFGAIGGEGTCDLLSRLILLAEAATRHGVYLILSSWYYLHTYWFLHDEALNDRLFAVEPKERFMVFAKFLHYILRELEQRNLADCVAAAEIFNEADGLYFITGYGNDHGLTDEEIGEFREKHEEALAWLQEQHPNILFAFDSWKADSDVRQIPGNMQIFNFHHYFLWEIYFEIDKNPSFFNGTVTEADIFATRQGRRPEHRNDWAWRISTNANINPDKMPEIEALLETEFQKNKERFWNKMENGLSNALKMAADHGDVPVIFGEGVSYITNKTLLWEEHSESYWDFLTEVHRLYRKRGVWGMVVRTCCGPEDPSWMLVPDQLLRVNKAFLEG